MVGIQQEATRAVGTARRDGKTGARIAPVGALVGLVVGGLTFATSPLWAPAQIPLSGFSGVLLLSVGVALYAMHMTLYGASAGQESWYLFASVSGFDAIWRIVAICAVGLVSAHLIGLEAAAVSPVLLWLLMVLLLPEARRVFSSRADVSSGRLLYNYTLSMGSSTANAVLMMGLPLLLNVSIDSNDPLQQVILAVLILAISITRSPIMIPLQAFQGVAVSAFLKQQNHPLRAFAKPAGALLGVGLVGAAAAYVLGPWLFGLLYPPKPSEVEAYAQVVTSPVLALLVFASAFLALLVLSGSLVIALNMHRSYVAGWVLAAAVACVVAVSPLPLLTRTLLALYAGPILGLLVHLGAMVWQARSVSNSGNTELENI
ncbi:hypothetical protein [Rothia mucilaginosa]|uniref:hypothetical protein n=1 Tax=Rothia mucilaginosa TaxID=43675 RepID=UPI0026F2A58B|nr:hypothetical protein [Rothia mucilaginosa]